MATVVFTSSINATAKKITLSVTDWDTIVTKAYIYYSTIGGEVTKIGEYTITGVLPENVYIYYDSSIGFSLTSGETDIVPDNVYIFYISENDTTIDTSDTAVYLYTDIQTRCCLSSKIAAIMDYECNDCKRNNMLNELFFMKLLLEGAQHDGSNNCGDWTEASKKLEYVNEMCEDSGECYKKGCS